MTGLVKDVIEGSARPARSPVHTSTGEAEAPTTRAAGSLRGGIAWSAVGNLAPALAGIVTAPILAAELGVVGRGQVAAAAAALALGANAFTLGLPEAITYWTARGDHSPRRILRTGILGLLGAGVVGTAVLVLLARLLAGGDAEVDGLIVLAAMGLAPSLVGAALRALAAGARAWRVVTLDRALSSFARLLAIGGLSITGHLTITSAVVAIALTSVAGAPVYLLLLRRRPLGNDSSTDDRPPVLAYGLRVWAGSLMGILLSRLDQTLMLPLSDATQLGLYVVAVTIAEVPLIVNGAVKDVLFASEASNRDEVRLAQAARVSTALTAVAAAGIGLAAIPCLPWMFGEDFAPALPVLGVLLLAVVLGNPGSVAGAALSGRGRPELRSVSLTVAVVVNLGVLLLLVPPFGAMGAALATLAGYVLAGYLNLFWLRSRFGTSVTSFLGVRACDAQLALRIGESAWRRLARSA